MFSEASKDELFPLVMGMMMPEVCEWCNQPITREDWPSLVVAVSKKGGITAVHKECWERGGA